MWRREAWTRSRVALALAGLILVLLVVGQLVLPRIAERVVRSEIGNPDAEVHIRAYPAWKLVFGRMDRLTVKTATVKNDNRSLTDLLHRAKKIGRTEATIDELRIDELRLHRLHVVIEDGRVRATTELTVSELGQLVPGGGSLRALPPNADGRPRFSASVAVLGTTQEMTVVVGASDGTITAAPESGLASLFSVTVFEDPALYVEAVTGTADDDTLRIAFSGTLQ